MKTIPLTASLILAMLIGLVGCNNRATVLAPTVTNAECVWAHYDDGTIVLLERATITNNAEVNLNYVVTTVIMNPDGTVIATDSPGTDIVPAGATLNFSSPHMGNLSYNSQGITYRMYINTEDAWSAQNFGVQIAQGSLGEPLTGD